MIQTRVVAVEGSIGIVDAAIKNSGCVHYIICIHGILRDTQNA